MRRFLLASFFIIQTLLSYSQQKIVIKRDTETFHTDQIEFYIVDTVYKTSFNNKGEALFYWDNTLEDTYGIFTLPTSSLLIYLNNENLEVTVNNSNDSFSFIGKYAKENEYMNDWPKRINPPDYTLNEEEFFNSLYTKIKTFHDEIDNSDLDNRFKELEKKRVTFTVADPIFTYNLLHPMMSGDRDYKPSTVFYENMEKFLNEEPTFNRLKFYQEFLLRVIVRCTGNDENLSEPEQYQLQMDFMSKHFKNTYIKSWMASFLAKKYIDHLGIAKKEDIQPFVEKWITEPKVLQDYNSWCNKQSAYAPGTILPDFSLKDITGKTRHLSDYKGKLVYIDVWATWCPPCKEEIPHLQKLEEKFKDKPIVFISMSTDRTPDPWDKMVKEQNLTGVQLYHGTSGWLNLFEISMIPQFILIDHEGKIIDAKAPRPSNPEVEELINKHLANL